MEKNYIKILFLHLKSLNPLKTLIHISAHFLAPPSFLSIFSVLQVRKMAILSKKFLLMKYIFKELFKWQRNSERIPDLWLHSEIWQRNIPKKYFRPWINHSKIIHNRTKATKSERSSGTEEKCRRNFDKLYWKGTNNLRMSKEHYDSQSY